MGLTALLCMLAFTINISEPLAIGSDLPKSDLKMQDVNGKMTSIKEAAKENGVLVMFSSNTCPYVVKNQDRTRAIAAHAIKKNVGVIILNSNEAYRSKDDSFDAMKAYSNNQQYKWNYVVDKNHEIADAFGANRTPEVFLFNKNMKLVYHGAIDDNPTDATAVNKEHLKIAINELTEGKQIAVTKTKSVGCNIKRIK